MTSTDGPSDDESEIMKVDPVQLVFSIAKAAEDHSDEEDYGGEEVDDDPLLESSMNQVRLDSSRSQSRLVRPETKEFLQTLHKYLDCRKQMDAKYFEVDELETLANFDLSIDSGGIELVGKEVTEDDDKDDPPEVPNAMNHGPSLGFKSEYQQQSVHGRPVRNLNELYEAAEVAFPVYQQLINSIMDRVRENSIPLKQEDDGKDLDRGDQNHGGSPESSAKGDSINVTFAPLKGKDRAQEKARDDYSKRTPDPGVSWLFEIVRGSILFSTSEQMVAALQVLQDDPSIHLVKAKNRFRNPALSGYRDWNIHIQIPVPKSSNGDEGYFHHICEIQMHHQALSTLDKLLHSHEHYEYFRSYFAGAMTSLQGRLADLELIDEGFSFPGGIDDDAFLDALLEAKPMEEDEEEEAVEEVEDAQAELPGKEARLVRLGRLFRLHLNEFNLALRVYGKLLSFQLENYKDPRHVEIGRTFDRIGTVLMKQGKFDSAMILYRHAFEIKKVALGDLDPSLGESLRCLSEAFQKKGRLTKALEYLQKAVDLYTEIKGEESSEVAYIYGGMAAIFRKKDKMDEALELYQKAVRIDINLNGEDTSTVAFVYNGMAWIYKYKDNLEEALRLFQRSHDITKRIYGDQHSSLCFTYNGIADILKRQDKLEEALVLYQKSLNISERRNGREHPATYFVYKRMCKILKTMGRGDEVLRISQMLKRRDSKRNSRNEWSLQ